MAARSQLSPVPEPPDGRRYTAIRSISSSVISSLVRSYSLVVLGLSWQAIRWACSSVPPLDR